MKKYFYLIPLFLFSLQSSWSMDLHFGPVAGLSFNSPNKDYQAGSLDSDLGGVIKKSTKVGLPTLGFNMRVDGDSYTIQTGLHWARRSYGWNGDISLLGITINTDLKLTESFLEMPTIFYWKTPTSETGHFRLGAGINPAYGLGKVKLDFSASALGASSTTTEDSTYKDIGFKRFNTSLLIATGFDFGLSSGQMFTLEPIIYSNLLNKVSDGSESLKVYGFDLYASYLF